MIGGWFGDPVSYVHHGRRQRVGEGWTLTLVDVPHTIFDPVRQLRTDATVGRNPPAAALFANRPRQETV